MATFAVAYIVMLLAMYFNGYIIISIFLGAGLGKFLCDWTTFRIPLVGLGQGDGSKVVGNDNLTFCCD
jgi:copper transporter 1